MKKYSGLYGLIILIVALVGLAWGTLPPGAGLPRNPASLTAKTTPVGADTVPGYNSANNNRPVKFTLNQILSTLGLTAPPSWTAGALLEQGVSTNSTVNSGIQASSVVTSAALETRLGGTSPAAPTAAEYLRMALEKRTETLADLGATETLDTTTKGLIKLCTLTANCAITIGQPTGPCRMTLYLIQGGVGSYTVTWSPAPLWTGGAAPVLSTAVGARDQITLVWDGTVWDGTYSLGKALAP